MKRLQTNQNALVRTTLEWWPLGLLLIIITCSFVYGWYFDHSHPFAGNSWADQTVYTHSANRMANGQLPTKWDLHFSIGYPLMGTIGHIVSSTDPFVAPSFALILASACFCFLAARGLLGNVSALLFGLLLFYWDGIGRTFNFASELFVIPWNNQVLFFAMAYFFWIFMQKLNKPPSYWFLGFTAAVTGVTVLSREESILFMVPLLAAYLYLTKANIRKWILALVIASLCYFPQVIVNLLVYSDVAHAGRHGGSYTSAVSSYFNWSTLYRNIWSTIINSRHFAGANPHQLALFQAAPWLWLAIPGVVVMLFRKHFPAGLKVFLIVSGALMLFYLSGGNMSASKLKFHCLRYIAPSFIALNFAAIFIIQQVLRSFVRNE